MYFSEFMNLAEGKKKERKKALKRMFDSGHRDMTGNVPDDPEYKNRRKSAIKTIMKGLKESPDNEADRLRKRRALEKAELERKKAAGLAKRREEGQKTGDIVSKREVRTPMPNAGKRAYHTRDKGDKYNVVSEPPKMKEYRF